MAKTGTGRNSPILVGSVAKSKRDPSRKKVRRLARALVGPVPSAKVIQPKTLRKKPKHKKPIGMEDAPG
jgi:hypothetical protein